MKVVGAELKMVVNYAMTYEQAKLIRRITHDYVSLAEFLTKQVPERFPEKASVLESAFHELNDGTADVIKRCDETLAVFNGRQVAVDSGYTARLQEEIKSLNIRIEALKAGA